MIGIITCLNFWKWIKPSFTVYTCSFEIIRLPYFLHAASTFTYTQHTHVHPWYVYVCVSKRARKWVHERLLLYSSQYNLCAQDFARGRLNHSRMRLEVRRRRNCLAVERRRGRWTRSRESGGFHSVVHYQFVPSCCRNGLLFVTRFQSDKYVLHVALWKRNPSFEWPRYLYCLRFPFAHDR